MALIVVPYWITTMTSVSLLANASGVNSVTSAVDAMAWQGTIAQAVGYQASHLLRIRLRVTRKPGVRKPSDRGHESQTRGSVFELRNPGLVLIHPGRRSLPLLIEFKTVRRGVARYVRVRSFVQLDRARAGDRLSHGLRAGSTAI